MGCGFVCNSVFREDGVCVRVCVCACVRASVRPCVRASVRPCVRACECDRAQRWMSEVQVLYC